jgi:acetamidase/formamidase
VNDPRGRHCHQDCAALTAGATIHLRAQVDGAGLCVADVHGYIAEGEAAFAGIEVAARVRLRVERSSGWYVDWPLVETPGEVMVCCSDTNVLEGTDSQQYVDVVRRAYGEMRKVVAARLGCSIADANALVAAAMDVRNCAVYGLGNFIQKEGKVAGAPDGDIAVVGVMPKGMLSQR